MKLEQILAKVINENIINDITVIDSTPRNKRIRYFEFQIDTKDDKNIESTFYLYGEIIIDKNDDILVRISKGDEKKKSFKYNHALNVLENDMNLCYKFLITNIHRTIRLCSINCFLWHDPEANQYELGNLSLTTVDFSLIDEDNELEFGELGQETDLQLDFGMIGEIINYIVSPNFINYSISKLSKWNVY